ncbi:5122_t:CDS:2 [Cetraspora pellucida]|uniref:5122_t:CDS:1 n=1 Tax=Cetraspora pellucida TaxID=1433469 RepID=A0ACA9MR52_9GLOM|nr:5122_t:CDS:2 [Cetraspora pellucida]
MPYEIVSHDFCLIVKNPRCQGQEITNGSAKEGCHKMTDDLRQINQNFRAFDVLVKQQVKLSKSKNEKEFNNSKKTLLNSFKSLKEKCEDESGVGFFYGSCIGLDGDKNIFATRIKETFKRLAKELGYYMKQIENSTWQQLANFQEKLKKLDKLNSEATQLTKE